MEPADSYGEPFAVEEPDESWFGPMSMEQNNAMDVDTSTEDTTPHLLHNNAHSIDAPMEDVPSDLLEVASSRDNVQQVEDHAEPTSSDAAATAEASTGIKRELESPSMEEAPKPKTRRRKGEAEPDYSGMTREKVKNNKRTGQACDRCKLRKLRCDTDPDGCMPCSSASHPCQVTDRVTGETFLRGEAGQLKAENEGLRAKVLELEESIQQLRSEIVSLNAQLFYLELMQAESSAVTGEDSEAAAIESSHAAAPESMVHDMFPEPEL